MKKDIKTVGEIWNDPIFRAFTESELNNLIKSRSNRPAPKQGLRYKRDWYDRMEQMGTLTPAYFLENIKLIWLKKSNLPRQFREVIEYVCGNAMQKSLTEKDGREKTNC